MSADPTMMPTTMARSTRYRHSLDLPGRSVAYGARALGDHAQSWIGPDPLWARDDPYTLITGAVAVCTMCQNRQRV
jgi:hypothetical protein